MSTHPVSACQVIKTYHYVSYMNEVPRPRALCHYRIFKDKVCNIRDFVQTKLLRNLLTFQKVDLYCSAPKFPLGNQVLLILFLKNNIFILAAIFNV